MTLTVQLLGRPRVSRPGGVVYQCRSRKSWALLAYLILSERPPARSQLASLLFGEAEDPQRALRWSLAEIRRCLDGDGSLDGDPVVLRLGPGVLVDWATVEHSAWTEAVELPGLGSDLLDGMAIRGAAAFDAWLLSAQRRVAAASEAILHEAALGSMSRGAYDTARDYTVRAAAMNPLDENHQALLIRLYGLTRDYARAQAQFAACSELFERELGVAPGPAIATAMRELRGPRTTSTDDASIEAIVEAGSGAVSAGAIEAGVQSLRTAVWLADRSGAGSLRVTARLVLAEALIHSLRGTDEEGLATLHEADRIALANHDPEAIAQARAELGYVDFLRAHYDRAEFWLTTAIDLASGAPSITAKATTYLGSVESDRANYGRAVTLLEQATVLSRSTGDQRRESFGRSMLGRISLLRGELDAATDHLHTAIALAEHDHWLAFLPWPQALLGAVQIARADPAGAADTLQQAFARACQLGDPCWEGVSTRGLALVAEASGDSDRAFDLLADARTRCNRLANPYVWLDVHILDAQCELGRRYRHPDTPRWVETMRRLASRTGMKELIVRSMLHGAALGHDGDADAAALLGADIGNPQLGALLDTASTRFALTSPLDLAPGT